MSPRLHSVTVGGSRTLDAATVSAMRAAAPGHVHGDRVLQNQSIARTGTTFSTVPASTTPWPLAPARFVKAIRRRGRRRRTRNSMEPPVPRRALVEKVPGGTSATSACRTASVATAPMRRPRRRPPVTYTRRDGAAQGWNASAPLTLTVARHVVRAEHRRVELVLDGKERVHHRRRGRNTVEDKCYALSGRR